MITATMNSDSYLFSEDSSLHKDHFVIFVNMVYMKSKPLQINTYLRHTHTFEIGDGIQLKLRNKSRCWKFANTVELGYNVIKGT
jgi:hypothetical protein